MKKNEKTAVCSFVYCSCRKSGLVVGASALDSDSFSIVCYNVASLSDHAAISAVFTVTKTADFTGNTGTLTVTKKNSFDMFMKKVFVIFTDLFKARAHLDEALEYLKG